MSDKYQNKYRIQSHRRPHWDYSGNGFYFITLVTQNRECNLGEIINTQMILSDFGKVVNDEWIKSFEIRNELFCDEYIIMPNHLHAIVVIDNPTNNPPSTDNSDVVDGSNDYDGTNETHIIETHGRASLQSKHHANQQFKQSESANPSFFRQPQSISSFIGGFKSAINSKIDDYIDEHQLEIPKYNRTNHFFQPNYHDHIIRNDAEHQRIRQYIINNPKNWKDDTFNSIGQ